MTMDRKKAYAIVTRIICEGKQGKTAKEYPEMIKFVSKDNYVDVKKFNLFFPTK
jgi:hypothetical protein